MQEALSPPRIAISDVELAAALGVSVVFLRKDRRTKRLIPFYRLGGRILYNLDRVLETLSTLEEGGSRNIGRRRSSAN